MAAHNYRAGLGHVGAYQVAGMPWLSGNVDMGPAEGVNGHQGSDHIQFPNVARSVTVINKSGGAGDDIRVQFNTGSYQYLAQDPVVEHIHYVTLTAVNDSITFNVKCKEIFVTGLSANASYQIVAELTHIPASEMYNLSGSGLTE